MNVKKWINQNCHDLTGKYVAITGATGGIGQEIVHILARLNANIIFLGRDQGKSDLLKQKLLALYPTLDISILDIDLSDIESVKRCLHELYKFDHIDILIHNAGIYNVPLCKTSTGYNNVFQVNFVSPYYLTKQLFPLLKKSESPKVVVVGSIAHNYSNIDTDDIDFSTRKKASKIYGNSKRFLMYSMYELFKNEDKIKLAITHPGITSTNMTNHYSKFIYWLIKYPMKVIFMSPKKACLSIIKGIYENCNYHEWIGPKIFNIWGAPKKRKLKTCSMQESKKIFDIAEDIYSSLK